MGPEVFLVEKIVGKRGRGEKVEYLVKWQGYGHEHNTWEKRDAFYDSNMIDDFEQNG